MASQEVDALDRKLLQALELDGRAPFSRIGEALGVSDQTVARRFRRLRTAAGLRVTGVADDARLGRDAWIVRLGCTPNVAERLAAALARRPDTQYVDLLSGGTEVMCAMLPRSRRERDELLLERLQRTPRVTSVSAHCILHPFFGGPMGWLRKTDALTPAEEAALRPPPAAPAAGPVALDASDEALLAALRRDGRAGIGELRAATGLSAAVVARRLEALRSTGVLYFAVEYDREPLGQAVEAMCWLTVAPHALAETGRAVAEHREVRFAAAVTGRANLAVLVLCRTTADLYRYLSERLGALTGVGSVETTLTLRRVKDLTWPAY
ncbi:MULTISPECIES: Lrp/AsnC family transcriptional regulator [Actinomadura]|uniref:Lrp/AsnC family transcriptional regulator n=1 Tax=Actinomadura TaxID=1988 RepID=UPI0003FEFA0B|nr:MULTISPECIES: AsnC family transcriptional regulator [Actinomadura]RSN51752.1 Lrp/AsnC family transcriptional regulator [Actinomadura sp. WAC 06369]